MLQSLLPDVHHQPRPAAGTGAAVQLGLALMRIEQGTPQPVLPYHRYVHAVDQVPNHQYPFLRGFWGSAGGGVGSGGFSGLGASLSLSFPLAPLIVRRFPR